MIRPLILVAMTAAPALAQSGDMIAVTYLCERGVEVPVVYVNPAQDESYAVAQIDGKLLGMRQVISGSGARYRSGDGAGDYQLWSKGDTALISVGPDDGSDTLLFQDCAARE